MLALGKLSATTPVHPPQRAQQQPWSNQPPPHTQTAGTKNHILAALSLLTDLLPSDQHVSRTGPSVAEPSPPNHSWILMIKAKARLWQLSPIKVLLKDHSCWHWWGTTTATQSSSSRTSASFFPALLWQASSYGLKPNKMAAARAGRVAAGWPILFRGAPLPFSHGIPCHYLLPSILFSICATLSSFP